jgi:hypothetical protein
MKPSFIAAGLSRGFRTSSFFGCNGPAGHRAAEMARARVPRQKTVVGGPSHDLDRQCLGGAGRRAACLFSGFGDVPLDQAAGPEDVSKHTGSRRLIPRSGPRTRGIYNGFLAAGLVWGLVQGVPSFAFQIKLFFLLCVIVAGVYGAATVSRRILFVQAVPAAIALALLWLA